MFELTLLAMACTAVALILVWLYRKLTEFKGNSVVSLSGNRSRLEPRPQQGYEPWKGLAPRKRAKRLAQHRVNAKPWGW